jgi:hypothetical protein
MNFRPDGGRITWKLHLKSTPEVVYQMLDTSAGRERFWAESAREIDGVIQFMFPNGWEYKSRIIQRDTPSTYQIDYFGSMTSFQLIEDGCGGTELTLVDENVPEEYRYEVTAGWVSVLMALKAAVDYGVDLRNHDPNRTWDQGFVNN